MNQLSAHDAARMIRDGQLTSEALMQACLDRIAQRDVEVRAWVALDPARALDEARAADRLLRERGPDAVGPLHGVPIGVKDILDTADHPTCYGSPIFRDHRPIADAACVALAREAGAIVLGKTATAEFASIHPPATRNPRNLAHGPGGSSSGSAAAVADAMVPLAFGTQTAGSTIRPAAFCGIVGYKPSFGLINRAGLKFSAESLDTIGLLARSVGDVALFAHAVAGQPLPPGGDHDARGTHDADRSRGHRREHRWRIGLCRTPYWMRADEGARNALLMAAERLAAGGASITEVELPQALEGAWDAHATMIRYEAARAMTWETRHHRAAFSAGFAERIDEGLAIPFAAWRVANARAVECRRLHEGLFSPDAEGADGIDILLTPSAIGEAPKGITHTGDSLFNRNWTLLGAPCIHLPTTTGPQGLPLGIQLVGHYDGDIGLLECARWVETTLQSDPRPA